jgi:calcineurin-like phosphoesterase family protein
MKQWIITDTHFNHKNIVKYENRPINYKEIIIKNCCELISPEDELYHLGDVIFSRKSELYDILLKIPGKKFLTKGNHDDEKAQWFKNKGFDVVSKYLFVDNILLSHIPMDLEPFKDMNIKFNIHGHFHRNDRKEVSRNKEFYPFYSNFHFNLSIEEMDYKPVLLYEFINKKILELKTKLTKKNLIN